ncbi:MAG: hypothetical protein Q8P67_12775 [archaeon]|nr:hypothetical protein [archaeon]
MLSSGSFSFPDAPSAQPSHPGPSINGASVVSATVRLLLQFSHSYHHLIPHTAFGMLRHHGTVCGSLPMRLKTGDVLLFSSRHLASYTTKLFTRSRWDHVGLVVERRGQLLLFEAVQAGVRLHDLNSRIASYAPRLIGVRRLHARSSTPPVTDAFCCGKGDRVMFSGALMTLKKSSKRWCALTGRCLFFFRHSQSKRPKSYVLLRNATISHSASHRRVFTVQNDQSALHLVAPTEQEYGAWFSAIEEVILRLYVENGLVQSSILRTVFEELASTPCRPAEPGSAIRTSSEEIGQRTAFTARLSSEPHSAERSPADRGRESLTSSTSVPSFGILGLEESNRLFTPSDIHPSRLTRTASHAHRQQLLDQFISQVENRPYEKRLFEILKLAVIPAGQEASQSTEVPSHLLCTQLVATAFQEMGLFPKELEAKYFIPRDFSKNKFSDLLVDCFLGDLVVLSFERRPSEGSKRKRTVQPPPKDVSVDHTETAIEESISASDELSTAST